MATLLSSLYRVGSGATLLGLLSSCGTAEPANQEVAAADTTAVPVTSPPVQAAAPSVLPVDSAPVASVKPAVKTVRLPHDFTLQFGRQELYDGVPPLTLYNHLQVRRADKLVYQDTTNEYEWGRRSYPTVFTDASGATIALLEVNNRDFNLLLRLRIKDDQAAVTDTLPAFQNGPGQLDDDCALELAGQQYSSQLSGENGKFTVYNPILYYELTAAGPVLDRELTMRKAHQIYGQFLGFGYNEQVDIPSRKVSRALQVELARIAAASRRR